MKNRKRDKERIERKIKNRKRDKERIERKISSIRAAAFTPGPLKGFMPS